MKKRALGNTGIDVSEIAFGGVEIGIPYGIGIKSASDMVTEKDAIKLLDAAVGLGINFFDTARLYGESEKIMGRAFKKKRDKVIINTKCEHFLDENGKIPGYRKLKNTVESSLNKSLKALQTDYVDVFMPHQSDIHLIENDEVIAVFTDLKKTGKIRVCGVSTYTVQETNSAIETGVWDVLQLPFNLLDQRQSASFTAAKQKGIGIIVRSVLMKGLLSGRGKNLHPELKKVENHIAGYDRLLEKTNFTLSELATKFALSFAGISSVLVGIDREEYLHQSIKVANGDYLNTEFLERAKKMALPHPDFLDLPYWDKMGWLT